MKEVDLQQYIWDNRERWLELLLPLNMEEIDDDYSSHVDGEMFEMDGEIVTMKPETFHNEPDPNSLFSALIQRRIQEYYEHVKDLYFLGKEIRLTKDADSTIRIDFLAYSSGRTWFTVIELKTNPIQAREAFTELLAYGNHLQTIFPGLSADNIFYLHIAPVDKRIVRESIINMLLFQQRAILALEPICQEDGTFKFKPWLPTSNDLCLYSNKLFAENNFDVVKIVWEYVPGHWNTEDRESEIDRMNRVSSYCAQLMESRQVSGFVYASHAPSSFFEKGFTLLNSIVIVGINPFTAKQKEGKTLVDFIPDLAKHVNENPEFIYNLSGSSITWCDHLMGIGRQIVQFMTTNLSGKKYESEMTLEFAFPVHITCPWFLFLSTVNHC